MSNKKLIRSMSSSSSVFPFPRVKNFSIPNWICPEPSNFYVFTGIVVVLDVTMASDPLAYQFWIVIIFVSNIFGSQLLPFSSCYSFNFHSCVRNPLPISSKSFSTSPSLGASSLFRRQQLVVVIPIPIGWIYLTSL